MISYKWWKCIPTWSIITHLPITTCHITSCSTKWCICISHDI